MQEDRKKVAKYKWENWIREQEQGQRGKINQEEKKTHRRKKAQARTCLNMNTRENATDTWSVGLPVLGDVIPVVYVSPRKGHTGAIEANRKKEA